MEGTCDVECDTVYKDSLAAAVSGKLVDVAVVRDSVRRLVQHRMRLGLFDLISKQARYGSNCGLVVD